MMTVTNLLILIMGIGIGTAAGVIGMALAFINRGEQE